MRGTTVSLDDSVIQTTGEVLYFYIRGQMPEILHYDFWVEADVCPKCEEFNGTTFTGVDPQHKNTIKMIEDTFPANKVHIATLLDTLDGEEKLNVFCGVCQGDGYIEQNLNLKVAFKHKIVIFEIAKWQKYDKVIEILLDACLLKK